LQLRNFIASAKELRLGFLLGKGGLVFGGVGGSEGAAIDEVDPQAAPEVFGGHCGLGFGEEGLVDVIQPFQGELVAGLAVGTGLVGGQGSLLDLAEVARLVDGLAAGGARLGDLPPEGPEGEGEVPAAVGGVGPLLLLGEAVVGHPGFKEGLELVAGGLGGGAELWELEGEEGGEGGEVWCRHVDSAYTVLLTGCLYLSAWT
jgi:hypothetical protein